MTQLDLLAELEPTPGTSGIVHGIRPHMAATCGWNVTRETGSDGDTFTLRYADKTLVTCPDCLAGEEESPWNTP